jgi:hypothetical protein
VDGIGILQSEVTAIKLRSSMSPIVENDLNRPIQSWESTTPALESHKYFTVVIHQSAEIDPIGAVRNGATAIEFSGNNGSKSLHHWE